MRRWRRRCGSGRGGGTQPIASVALWLCVGWGALGATCGSVALLDAERCPPGWPEVGEDMDRLEASGEAEDLRLYLAVLVEHCNRIEDQLGD